MVKSIRGRDIDMQALRIKNQHVKAVGNANVNARGDLLGKGGKIIKTREQLALEYNTKNSNAVKNVPVSKDITKQMQEEATRVAAGKAKHAKAQASKSE